MNSVPQRAPVGAASVAATYALFAALWIAFSDRALNLLFKDRETLVVAGMLKGWLFVAVTSLLLYLLVRRMSIGLRAAHDSELAAERERRLPPPMLVAIAEASDDVIFAKDELGRYVLFNRAATKVAGRPAEQALGQDDRAIFPAPQAERIIADDRRVRLTGVVETDERVIQTTEGERIYLTTRGPLRDADGRIFGIYGIGHDITERKRAEQALNASAADLDATLQALPDLLFELDAEGRYIKIRALNEAQLIAPAEQLLGHLVSEALPAAAAEAVMLSLAAAHRNGVDFGHTMSLPLASGERHFELSVARKPELQGQGARFIVLSRDITARRAVEVELRQRNAELERFNVATIERELRMVALKREVNDALRAAGLAPRYDTAFADTLAAQTAS